MKLTELRKTLDELSAVEQWGRNESGVYDSVGLDLDRYQGPRDQLFKSVVDRFADLEARQKRYLRELSA